jgi:hypothetical protein
MVTVSNLGSDPCPLPAGSVSVQPESAPGGRALGSAASSSPSAAASTLAPGASLRVQFAVVNSENFDPASCDAAPAAAIRIAWAEGPATDLSLPAALTVCTAGSIVNVQQVTVG